jgi:hypothetical protein
MPVSTLEAADVGVAMGAHGSGASSEAADVVLLVDRLDRLAETLTIAHGAPFFRSLLIIRLLKHIALTHQARPDRRTNGRRPRDRGNDPPPGSGCVLEADRLSRGGTARLNVGFVFFRRMIALDGWLVSATSRTKEQGGHDQRDMQQFRCADVWPPASD